jgi:hypothetical protein
MKVKYAAAAETRCPRDVALCDGELNFKFIRKQPPMSGCIRAQIGVLINNTPARRAYEKSGFKFDSEKRDPGFEATFSTPGI